MQKDLTIIQQGFYYVIREDFGILKKGMRCYCYSHTSHDIILFFSQPLLDNVTEIKLSKKLSHLLKRI